MRRTYPTKCPWCKRNVYYHTNGNGDSVYFDHLTGAPWPEHYCWEQRSRFQTRAERIRGEKLLELSILKEIATGVRPVAIKRVPGESTVNRILRENRARKSAYQEFLRLQIQIREQRRGQRRS